MANARANRSSPGPAARLAAFGCLVAVIGLILAGCEQDGPPRPELPPQSPQALPTGELVLDGSSPPGLRELLGDASVSADAAPANSASLELRNRRLALEPRRVPAQRIAFGKGRFARLTDQAVVVLETKGLSEQLSLPVDQPRRVIPLRDGSLLVAAADRLIKLPPDQESPEVLPRIPLFAESLVFGDRANEALIWLRHGFDPTLYRYRLEPATATLLRLEEFFELPGHDARGFAPLKDGSFVFTAQQELHRFFPNGKHTKLRLPDAEARVWRILPARRVDRFWIAYADGRIKLVQLGPRLRAVHTLELPSQAFDVATSDTHIAVIRLEQQPGEERKWTLVVLDLKGKPKLTAELPNDPASAGADWVAGVVRNKEVALPSRGSLVAVGGPGWLGMWNIGTGQQLLPR